MSDTLITLIRKLSTGAAVTGVICFMVSAFYPAFALMVFASVFEVTVWIGNRQAHRARMAEIAQIGSELRYRELVTDRADKTLRSA